MSGVNTELVTVVLRVAPHSVVRLELEPPPAVVTVFILVLIIPVSIPLILPMVLAEGEVAVAVSSDVGVGVGGDGVVPSTAPWIVTFAREMEVSLMEFVTRIKIFQSLNT